MENPPFFEDSPPEKSPSPYRGTTQPDRSLVVGFVAVYSLFQSTSALLEIGLISSWNSSEKYAQLSSAGIWLRYPRNN